MNFLENVVLCGSSGKQLLHITEQNQFPFQKCTRMRSGHRIKYTRTIIRSFLFAKDEEKKNTFINFITNVVCA